MSGTQPTPTPAPVAAPNDSITGQQFILGMVITLIVAIVLGAVIYRGDAAQINLILGFVFAMGSTVTGFYFGSSKSSQAKDTTLAAQLTPPPGTTTTTTTLPASPPAPAP